MTEPATHSSAPAYRSSPIQQALDFTARPRYVRNSDTSRAAQASAEPKAGRKSARESDPEKTLALALEFFNYDANTGVLTWKKKLSRRTKIGAVVGWKMPRGYISVNLGNRKYLAHRVIWLMHHGKWPENYIDHINGDCGDNRIDNLRDVTQFINMQNQRGPNRDNQLGLLGVMKKRKRFRAQIRFNAKYLHLGTFDTPEEAHDAYVRAKRDLHEGCTI